ncbi:MAG TPA: hypothetical protein PLI27_04415 [Ignavibacteriales bacterium]|nr:hypothetical protein [Ignavibacteriales bacterium]HOL80535.1 hypothetical protein [Ignavibacteriales bacterium]HOM64224.1 hypothetical protein [Ignavibacteriales bacterium]HPD67303.1 hypothetical protein [Ignavibacteriales bacterium]HPP33129.1 hypothetical protein [Ignavibacteriales bacterium]
MNVFEIFNFKLQRNLTGLKDFIDKSPDDVKSYIYDFDTINGITFELIPEDSVDIVITSPPYGDYKTTVAYGQYSRFANKWFGYEQASKVDNYLMGG